MDLGGGGGNGRGDRRRNKEGKREIGRERERETWGSQVFKTETRLRVGVVQGEERRIGAPQKRERCEKYT